MLLSVMPKKLNKATQKISRYVTRGLQTPPVVEPTLVMEEGVEARRPVCQKQVNEVTCFIKNGVYNLHCSPLLNSFYRKKSFLKQRFHYCLRLLSILSFKRQAYIFIHTFPSHYYSSLGFKNIMINKKLGPGFTNPLLKTHLTAIQI